MCLETPEKTMLLSVVETRTCSPILAILNRYLESVHDLFGLKTIADCVLLVRGYSGKQFR
jgi:hypothetical protein